MDARGSTNTLVAALLASFIVLLAPSMYNAVAGEIVDGSVPANGLPQAGDVGATWNGSAHKVMRSDAAGILRTTEEYPYHLQNDRFLACDSTTTTVINGVVRPLGQGWSVSPFGARNIVLSRVNVGPPCVLRLYLYGSDDNVNFYPILSDVAWAANGDSSKVDTLGVTFGATQQPSYTTRTYKIPLPETVYPGRYVQVWASRDSSAGSVNKIRLEYEGRWK